ncbi:MAG: gliding motility-associated C-terminal domain-containing protein [Bacteroidales bacterium]|jgi:gliding motility-associated-like protein|nr:gliding motility-associated C-terminal domain-containing protein [Bacteroidales bacterium]
MKTDFEKYMHDIFEKHSETPSPQCWSNISNHLDKIPHHVPPATDASSVIMQILQSTIGKIGIGVAVVSGISATVYFTTKNDDIVKEVVTQTIVETTQIVPTDDVNTMTLPADETAISLPVTKTKKEIPENSEKNLATEEHIPIVEPQENVNHAMQTENKQAMPASIQNQSQKQTEIHSDQPINPSINNKQTMNEPKTNDASFPSELPENQTEEIVQPRFNIPNIFSPNGDNINDFFIIENPEDVTEGHLYVYNITGKVLYENKNYHNEWNGENLPDGLYLYIYKFIYKEREFIRKGTVTIKRK